MCVLTPNGTVFSRCARVYIGNSTRGTRVPDTELWRRATKVVRSGVAWPTQHVTWCVTWSGTSHRLAQSSEFVTALARQPYPGSTYCTCMARWSHDQHPEHVTQVYSLSNSRIFAFIDGTHVFGRIELSVLRARTWKLYAFTTYLAPSSSYCSVNGGSYRAHVTHHVTVTTTFRHGWRC